MANSVAHDTSSEVVIIGAGLAGMSAARVLAKAGLEVRVLEGRSEVGGRTRSRLIGGESVDLGGETIGKPYVRIRRLARELGISIERSGMLSSPVQWRVGGEIHTGRLPRLSPNEAKQLAILLWRVSRLAKTVNPYTPWTSGNAIELDQISVATWLSHQEIRGRAHELMTLLLSGLFTTSIERLSLLHVLWLISREGGLVQALGSAVGYRLSGGTQQLAIGIAKRLPHPVVTNCPVVRIEQTQGAVSAYSEDGSVWSGRAAIVCVPLPTLNHIVFEPPLPEGRKQLGDALNFGSATSIVAGSPRRLTVKHRTVLGGSVLAEAWRRGRSTMKGITWHDKNDRAADATAEMTAAFETTGYESYAANWTSDRFSMGSFLAPEPGQLSRYGPYLRESYRAVHFATAERSSRPDSMEGAVESGENTASTVLRNLQG